MTTRNAQHSYTIKEAASLTGLPASTLAATGMSISDMRAYVSNGLLGPAAATEQVALRQRYVRLKIDYWHAVQADDTERADLLATEARALADELKQTKNP